MLRLQAGYRIFLIFQIMIAKKKIIILSIIVIAAASAFWGVPSITVLKVNGKNISYGNFLKIKGALEKSNSFFEISMKEDPVEIAFLNLIEQDFLDILIDNVDRNILFESEKAVAEAIESTPNLSLDEASKKLYNLSAEDFKELVLIPQAKKNFLDKHFNEKGEDILMAWASLYGTATVKVYYPGYYWDTAEYTIKKK